MRNVAWSFVVLVGVLVACGGAGSSSGATSGRVLSAEQRSGIATYYDADGSGNCSFDPSPDDLDVVALNFPEYAGSASCGSCLRVRGPKGEVTVRVTDSCPPCSEGHLDLSEQAFEKIAEKVQGRVDVTYQLVPCDVGGNIVYHFKEGSSQFWTAIQVRNHRVPIAKLEYRRDGAYVEMKRESYNYFVAADGVGEQPSGLAIRVTATDGQTLEDTLPAVHERTLVTGTSQFR